MIETQLLPIWERLVAWWGTLSSEQQWFWGGWLVLGFGLVLLLYTPLGKQRPAWKCFALALLLHLLLWMGVGDSLGPGEQSTAEKKPTEERVSLKLASAKPKADTRALAELLDPRDDRPDDTPTPNLEKTEKAQEPLQRQTESKEMALPTDTPTPTLEQQPSELPAPEQDDAPASASAERSALAELAAAEGKAAAIPKSPAARDLAPAIPDEVVPRRSEQATDPTLTNRSTDSNRELPTAPQLPAPLARRPDPAPAPVRESANATPILPREQPDLARGQLAPVAPAAPAARTERSAPNAATAAPSPESAPTLPRSRSNPQSPNPTRRSFAAETGPTLADAPTPLPAPRRSSGTPTNAAPSSSNSGVAATTAPNATGSAREPFGLPDSVGTPAGPLSSDALGVAGLGQAATPGGSGTGQDEPALGNSGNPNGGADGDRPSRLGGGAPDGSELAVLGRRRGSADRTPQRGLGERGSGLGRSGNDSGTGSMAGNTGNGSGLGETGTGSGIGNLGDGLDGLGLGLTGRGRGQGTGGLGWGNSPGSSGSGDGPFLPQGFGAGGGKPGDGTLLSARTAPNRLAIVERFGGSRETEAAVALALTWLANHQTPTGHWDSDNFSQQCPAGDRCSGPAIERGSDTGLTGLALLAFLGAGHTHRQSEVPEYQEVVRRGLQALLLAQRTDGDLRGPNGEGRIYCHAMATLALTEAYSMSGDDRLKQPAQLAIDWLCAAQHRSSGGWRYNPGEFGDTSVFGWAILALRSAESAKLSVPKEVWQRSLEWLPLVSSGSANGLASYQQQLEPTEAMTAEALLCRQIFTYQQLQSLSEGTEQEAIRFLSKRLPDHNDYHLYYWYYGTLSMFQVGGSPWQQWNDALVETLLRSQVKSGHARGSWEPQKPFGVDGGRIFTTATSALCLEVYYRYLPMYVRENK